MNKKEFSKIVENRITKICEILDSKAKEYGSDDDILRTFKVAAKLLNSTPERTLKGMLAKHEVSVLKIIDELDKDIIPSESVINEKIGDILGYYILLEALLTERLKH